jgi:hypothetical protein
MKIPRRFRYCTDSCTRCDSAHVLPIALIERTANANIWFQYSCDGCGYRWAANFSDSFARRHSRETHRELIEAGLGSLNHRNRKSLIQILKRRQHVH